MSDPMTTPEALLRKYQYPTISTWYGKPVIDLDKEELLKVIEHLQHALAAAQKWWKRDVDFYKQLAKVNSR